MLDKIFIINLEHRKDRKDRILLELDKQNITNYEFFIGVEPDEKMINNWNKNYLSHLPPHCVRNYEKYKKGCLGCLLSHLEIMKISLERKYKNILILEDDCSFEISYDFMIKSLKDFKKDFNLLYLCGSHMGKKFKETKNIYKITKTLTTGSYIVNETIMKFICKEIINYPREVDVFYSEIVQKKFDCYAFFPRITRQLSGFSDIQQTNVNYKL